MDEKEFLMFVQEIVKHNSHVGSAAAFTQMVEILRKNGEDQRFIELLDNLKTLSNEKADLAQTSKTKPLSIEDINVAIRRGKEREAREEAARRARC